MVVGIVDGPAWIVRGKLLGVAMTIGVIVGAGHDVEMAQLVDDRPGPRIGSLQAGVPERSAHEDLVGLVRKHVGENPRLAFRSGTPERDRLVRQGVPDALEIRSHLSVARRRVGAEPGLEA
jgi:hypothetical protein